MINLKELISNDEWIAVYNIDTHVFNTGAVDWNCIISRNYRAGDDISACLEETLHRILEAGGTEEDVYRIMAAEKIDNIDKEDDIISIDLGYCIKGNIIRFEPLLVKDDEVNNALKDVVDYLKSTENVWNEMKNLKLYDAFFEAENLLNKYPLVKEDINNDYNEIFHIFCEEEYEYFIEWMKEEGMKDERNYIRRTSSFFLTNINDKDYISVLYNLFDEFKILDINLDKKDGNIIMQKYGSKKEYAEALDNLRYISTGEFLADIKKFLEDAVRESEYIDDLKTHQIERFDEWMSEREALFQAEKEYQEKRQWEIDLATMPCYI